MRVAVATLCVHLVVVLTACSEPTHPTVSVVAAHPASVESHPLVPFYSQPVTLSIVQAVQTGSAPLATDVEVAADSHFATIVLTRAVAPATNGPASVALERLEGGRTYFWRVRTTTADRAELLSQPASFSVGPPLLLAAPAPVQPVADSYPGSRPTYAVRNAARSGPAAAISYQFQVARDIDFTAPLAVGTIPETEGQTAFTPDVALAPGGEYYWRAQAVSLEYDVRSAWSAPQPFTTFFPGDGQFPYRLIVRTGSMCNNELGHGPCGSQRPWPTADMSFDGTLVIAGSRLRLELPPYSPTDSYYPRIAVVLERTGTDVRGTATGSTPERATGYRATFLRRLGAGAAAAGDDMTGHSDNQGRFDGNLSGTIGLWRFGFPCDVTWGCQSDAFVWTLMPR